jgi:UDP-GlcNAc:undecaprenyl-phosphate/decaprenyl-phosphate GlcNAc-1-phosphate transferase
VSDSPLFLCALFVVPLAISWILTLLLLNLAPRIGLLDVPGDRKVHTVPTPRAGGLAIYAAVTTTAFVFPVVLQREFTTCLVAGFFIVLIGFIDDLRPLPWQLRLGVQALAALVVVVLWQSSASWGVRALSVVWIVGLINAFNMLDNMDALSAGVAWIAAGMLALAQIMRMENSQGLVEVTPYLLLMGALTGFLWFNRPPARIFMGDAGSTFLGFFLGVGSLHPIYAGQAPADARAWELPLCIFAVPCYDLGTVVLLRLRQGRSPFHADKQHLSHRLVALGLKPRIAVFVIHLLALASGLAGLVVMTATGHGPLLVGAMILCFWISIAVIEYFRHFCGQN